MEPKFYLVKTVWYFEDTRHTTYEIIYACSISDAVKKAAANMEERHIESIEATIASNDAPASLEIDQETYNSLKEYLW
jgi:hypothetical protein